MSAPACRSNGASLRAWIIGGTAGGLALGALLLFTDIDLNKGFLLYMFGVAGCFFGVALYWAGRVVA